MLVSQWLTFAFVKIDVTRSFHTNTHPVDVDGPHHWLVLVNKREKERGGRVRREFSQVFLTLLNGLGWFPRANSKIITIGSHRHS